MFGVNEEKLLERKIGTFSEFRPPLKQDYLTHTTVLAYMIREVFSREKN